jgi:multidrug resistance efflux pump
MTTPSSNPLALPDSEKPDRSDEASTLADRVRSLRLPESSGGEGRGGSWLAWIVALLLGVASAYLGYRVWSLEQAMADSGGTGGTTAGQPGPGPGAPGVGANAPAGNGRSLETGGYLIPVRRVQVSPKVGGQVIHMFYEEGEYVEAGMPLAIVDRTKFVFSFRERSALAESLKNEWDRLRVNLKIEEDIRAANLAEGQANLTNMQTKYRIAKEGGRATSEEDLRNALYSMDMAAAKLKNLQGLLKVTRDTARIEIEKAYQSYQQSLVSAQNAEDDLDNTIVPAPSSGIILKKYAEDGNMVRPEAFSNGLSASLYDLADLTQMEVDVDISERDLDAVFVGQKCQIRMEAFPDRLYTGYVARFLPEGNRSKASVSARVRVDVPDGDRYLRPELRARVKFLPAEPRKK